MCAVFFLEFQKNNLKKGTQQTSKLNQAELICTLKDYKYMSYVFIKYK